MRNLLALLGAATLTFVGLGWYLDWYKIARKPSPTEGTQRLELDLNPQKIGNDVVNGAKKVGSMVEQMNEQNNAPAAPAKTDEQPKPADPTPSSKSSSWLSTPSLKDVAAM